ncbi:MULTISPECIES: RagB/SusD family nutrient uptake outer membrane protein [Dyadobacter]|uniref:RagB/SusD family nutrient uptake outer membrane protein n=1 Tax=Dyadobacter chenhuakuii TaxID=2909339 RepID=A0ABY4XS27_9BACT|nr:MULTISPECIES: RagB/SusD family nutrient uptake outer membrane protein [Dyadobacter]MCE7070197.1 RagB/SusD family nutrient uptake outer membrane protein [Dyadobacter sp. CY327]MCF2492494.1 RagB/SusD family nutrient uptake outer membrane protein [Dyadobacter chenhuakuii]MCF2520489.1 RagB/SusD family nutrient uptake outer membrane protein [Dyadobacter sp. CY351]USJ33207.1 RagB/SusD family nutrient uptake outer membrane protein [Dyadobacter chenhuakuii]
MTFRYIKKSYKYIGLMALMLMGQSCSDLLEEEVISNIGNDYINTPKGFEDAAKSAYSSLRNYYGTQQGITMTEFGTDLYATGADGGYKGFHFYDAQLQPTVDYLATIWDETYRGINVCNAVIERAPAATVSDAIKKARVAEMKFLRAHYYFLLMQQYGPVDLRLTETILPTKKTTRAPESEIYKQIIADLESALPDLEAKSKATDYGRATKPAAEHLLARVFLAKGNSTSKAADDYAKAATYASNVINNYTFKLLPDFASVFDQANQNHDEVVFAVQYTTDPLTNSTGNSLHLYFGMQYDVQAGMVRDILNGRPFKRMRPTKYCLETVFADRVNDSRYKKTFKDTWLSNNPGKFTNVFDNSKTEVTFKAGDTAIFIPGYEMPLAERAKKPYQVLVPSRYDEALFPVNRKFLDPLRPDRTYEPGSRDFMCFRLADTYLLLAEAQLLTGKVKEATDAINMVRRRAAFAGKAAAMEIKQADMNMEMLMEERGRELLGEQIRWMDLKRWGNLVERVQKYNPQAAPNVKAIHLLRPIPQTQIDRTEGGATAFPQNPGY